LAGAAAAAAVNVADVVAVTTSEDSQQKLQETCEQLLRQLQEARRNVGRPEDLRVSHNPVLCSNVWLIFQLILLVPSFELDCFVQKL